MKILTLPGASQETVPWLNNLAGSLVTQPYTLYSHKYLFWEEPDTDRNLNRETHHLPEEQYDLVLAKSIGALILLNGLAKKTITLNKAIVIGLPLDAVDRIGLERDHLHLLGNPSICIVQQADDKLGKARELVNYSPAKLLIIEGDDHMYLEEWRYLDQLRSWLDSVGINSST